MVWPYYWHVHVYHGTYTYVVRTYYTCTYKFNIISKSTSGMVPKLVPLVYHTMVWYDGTKVPLVLPYYRYSSTTGMAIPWYQLSDLRLRTSLLWGDMG